MDPEHELAGPWAGALMNEDRAKEYLSRNIHLLKNRVQASLEQPENRVRVIPNEVLYLTDFGVRRAEDGCLSAFERTNPGETRVITHLQWPVPVQWLQQVAARKLRLLYVEEMRRLTGIDYSLDDLANDPGCTRFTIDMWPFAYDGIAQAQEAIQGLMDKEVSRLTRKCFADQATLDCYNLVCRHRRTLRRLERQCAALLPLIAHAAMAKLIRVDDNAFRSLKHLFEQAGMTPRTWKMLCRMPVRQVAWLAGRFALPECLEIVRHFADVGIIPCAELLEMSARQRLQTFRPVEMPPWFDRAAAEAMQALTTAEQRLRFLKEDYELKLDWLRAWLDTGRQPDTHQKKGGWHWITQQSERWHEEQVRKRHSRDYHWESALAAYTDGDYEIVPLTSSVDLALEGEVMHHCVGGYDQYCHDGHSRVFSIRQKGRRLATVQLGLDHNPQAYSWAIPERERQSKRWSVRQNRGPCNCIPSKEVMAVARRLEDRYNEALCKQQAAQLQA